MKIVTVLSKQKKRTVLYTKHKLVEHMSDKGPYMSCTAFI